MLSAHYTTLIELSDILCKGTGNIATLYKFGDESNLVSCSVAGQNKAL